MSLEKNICEIVVEALEEFYKHDLDLLIKPYEITISAKIGMHLHSLLITRAQSERFHVDCEYYRAAMDKKVASSSCLHDTMRPDIIIHHRALLGQRYDSREDNLLFCEVKIHNIDENDEQKIECALNEYQYVWGLSIHNIDKRGVTLRWVQKGQKADDNALDVVYQWNPNNNKLEVKR